MEHHGWGTIERFDGGLDGAGSGIKELVEKCMWLAEWVSVW